MDVISVSHESSCLRLTKGSTSVKHKYVPLELSSNVQAKSAWASDKFLLEADTGNPSELAYNCVLS